MRFEVAASASTSAAAAAAAAAEAAAAAANKSGSASSSNKAAKYGKKSIKILSVSSRALTSLTGGEDVQLKTYEFTEKCLSFRLAAIDIGSPLATQFDIKLVNLYDKFLCALVNYSLPSAAATATPAATEDSTKTNEADMDVEVEAKDPGSRRFSKLFRIKHEENAAATNAVSRPRLNLRETFNNPYGQVPKIGYFG